MLAKLIFQDHSDQALDWIGHIRTSTGLNFFHFQQDRWKPWYHELGTEQYQAKLANLSCCQSNAPALTYFH